MAASEHWLTNRGMLLLVQGLWDEATASTGIKMGLLAGASVPAAHTKASIQTVNTVTELLALTGFDEPVGGWYARSNLSRTAASEDDTNHRVNMDASDVTRTAATLGETIWGGFWFDDTVPTNDTTRIACGCYAYAAPIPTNGSNFTETITDLVRASQP